MVTFSRISIDGILMFRISKHAYREQPNCMQMSSRRAEAARDRGKFFVNLVGEQGARFYVKAAGRALPEVFE